MQLLLRHQMTSKLRAARDLKHGNPALGSAKANQHLQEDYLSSQYRLFAPQNGSNFIPVNSFHAYIHHCKCKLRDEATAFTTVRDASPCEAVFLEPVGKHIISSYVTLSALYDFLPVLRKQQFIRYPG